MIKETHALEEKCLQRKTVSWIRRVRMRGATCHTSLESPMFSDLYWRIICVPVGSQLHSIPNIFEQLLTVGTNVLENNLMI